MPRGRHRFGFEQECIVECEQVRRIDFHFLLLLAIEPDFHGQVRLVFAALPHVIGQSFNAQRGVARAAPVSCLFAIVQEVLHET